MHRIDPRIVIIQIVLSGICAFWIFKPLAMLCEVIFLMSFLLYLQHPKEALRLGVWFAFLVGLYALLNESNAPQIIVQPVFLLRKLSPLLGVMVLSLKALTVSELFMGLQKLHCPKSATLALAVALRFIPTIRHELEQIRNGMKTRGVPLNVITFVKAPAMTTEYMIIPFIMRCIDNKNRRSLRVLHTKYACKFIISCGRSDFHRNKHADLRKQPQKLQRRGR